jgi:hypothetical protein
VGAGGCKPKQAPAAPPDATRVQPSSSVLADADVLVRAIGGEDLERVRQWMSPELRSRIPAELLEEAALHLRNEFGAPQGVLEERTHQEGKLLWYSGLWVHRAEPKHKRAGDDAAVLSAVLYQFALDDRRRLARLLIREHWFLESLKPPADMYVPVTRLHFPGAGEWTISHGGRSDAMNHHYDTVIQRFAYDIVVKKNGRRKQPDSPSSDNRSYYCYGREILAPAAGTIVLAVNDVRDNIPGQRGKKGGNGVVIDHGFGEFSSLWHAIPGTVRVKAGDVVHAGQVIAQAGNSGHSSGPHLHYHLSTRGRRGGDFGLPAPFVDVWLDGGWYENYEPKRGDRVRNDPPQGVQRRDQASGPRVLLAF